MAESKTIADEEYWRRLLSPVGSTQGTPVMHSDCVRHGLTPTDHAEADLKSPGWSEQPLRGVAMGVRDAGVVGPPRQGREFPHKSNE